MGDYMAQVAAPGAYNLANVHDQQKNEQTASQAGKRFSLDSTRVLNKWLANHPQHPYPSVRDVESTILNWFANARRRRKFRPPVASELTSEPSGVGPRDIPSHRPPTPFVGQETPLERWKNSPPEDEPSSISAIARAVSNASSALVETPDTAHARLRQAPSSTGTSITSADNSDSSRSSHASINSHASDASLESLRKLKKKRRRALRSNKGDRRVLSQVCHRFQCTFCTETFKLKHTWQRHEITLHLSLEQWVCSPSGPFILNQQTEPECVYCGLVNPERAHFDMHNHDFCFGREREERVSYRKDHLRQHLRLVHGSQFSKWPMEGWKFKLENVQSRCGFCDDQMATWSERVNHLAEHFKDGKTMADWRGNWGFDASIHEMVENAMPPAFELLQSELDYFFSNYVDVNHCVPPDELLHLEACCIIFGAELSYNHPLINATSWLRDLLMGTEDVVKKAQMTPMRSAARSRFTELKIHSKNDIFEDCKLEASLRQYVDFLQMLDFEIGDDELQQEACSIIDHIPGASPMFTNLLVGLIYSSTKWLAPFRLRVGLPADGANPHSAEQSLTLEGLHAPASAGTLVPNTVAQRNEIGTDSEKRIHSLQNESRTGAGAQAHKVVSLNMYRGLTRELTRFVARTISPLNPTSHVPTDEELQYQARWIMYDSHDVWNQTPADNMDWLSEFKKDSSFFENLESATINHNSSPVRSGYSGALY
ncbi:uncharacterized protein FOBCDRAFT_241473 [Fusarium oxysporum Fo47]|uniref:uncharacterized protein n=1 Tax=Fusarium oxysporum Fo47 TaxID=660027 RepID=UPI0028699597|nr:uncharacterized protein FOBCDRAFT_241473 [Fusarium oxysporum Fo47]WJG35630.1 hypothetical protein FOBCDRAFT_241473 [Fusarium oxysporum Fo47]